MTVRDIDKQVKAVVAHAPAAALTATTTSAAVDLAGYRNAMAIVNVGVVTDGTWDVTLTESDTSDGTFTTVAAGDLSGAFVTVTSAADAVVQEVGYLGSKRFLKVVITETEASTSGGFFSSMLLLANPVTAPAA